MMYHGTTSKNARRILRSGKTRPEFFLTDKKSIAKRYAVGTFGRVLSFEDMDVEEFSENVFVAEKGIERVDNVWRPICQN